MTLSNPDACRCMGSWIYEQLSDDEISYLFCCSGVCTFCRGKCRAQLTHRHVLSLKLLISCFHNSLPAYTGLRKKAPPGRQRPSHTESHSGLTSSTLMVRTHTLDLTPDAPRPQLFVPIQLLIKDSAGKDFCKFRRICATGNSFVRLIVGSNSILNFPAKI